MIDPLLDGANFSDRSVGTFLRILLESRVILMFLLECVRCENRV